MRIGSVGSNLENLWKNFDEIHEAYLLSEHLTADKMMVLFRDHCPFKVYMLKKPTKYGIKVYGLVHVTSNYVFSFEIYAGQQPEGNFWISKLLSDVIIRVIDPIRNSGMSTIVDNYFILLSLFRAMKEHGLQAVETINKNRTFVPLLFLATKTTPNQNRPDPSSMFGFSNPGTLMSYCSSTRRVTILFSMFLSTCSNNFCYLFYLSVYKICLPDALTICLSM